MNGWLVVARCPIDEIPMGLEKDEIGAVKLANILGLAEVIKQARRFSLDTSSAINVSILEFRKGVPFGGYREIKNLEGAS